MFDAKKIEKETRALWVPKMNKIDPGWKDNIEHVRNLHQVIKEVVKEKSNPQYSEIIGLTQENWKGQWPWSVDSIILKAVNIERPGVRLKRFIFVEINGKTYALNGETAAYYHVPVVTEKIKVSGDISRFIMYIQLDGGAE